jgi:hypothetical protein
MGSELGKKMHATPNAIHRHDTADAVALRVLHDRNFVEEMVRHWVIKLGVPFQICEMLRDLMSRIVK